MNTQLTPFEFQSHKLRLLVDDQGEPWFIAMEVAEILGYTETEKMTRRLDDDEKQNSQIGGFGPRGVTLINESGLFAAILGSRKPEAKTFRRWVTGEVLPSIRQTGGYLSIPEGPLSLAEKVRLYNHLEDMRGMVDGRPLLLTGAEAEALNLTPRRLANALRSHEARLREQAQQEGWDTIIEMELAGKTRREIMEATGKPSAYVRQVVFQARRAGLLPAVQGV